MRTARPSHYYRTLHAALRSLYSLPVLTDPTAITDPTALTTLSSPPDDDDFAFTFDDSLFDAAAREILDAGGYDPKMLTGKNGSALIGETFRAFDEAIGSALGSKPDPAVAAALRENAFVFSGFKTHAEMEQVAALITDEKGNIRPFNEFLNDVKQINQEYNHRYLRTEYNQAVQSAQMASKWADFERDKAHINLQYRTANDERVRASHRILHGVTLPVDDKFWEQYTPPNGWGCRCTVVAVPKDDPDFPVRDAQGSTINGKEVFPTPAYEIFKTNTAKAKKVFPDKHPYLPKGCGECQYKRLIFDNAKAICKACRKVDAASAKWSRETVRKHYKNVINGKSSIEWDVSIPGINTLTITYQDIKTVTGKPHKHPYMRNMAVYYLRSLFKDARYLGYTKDIKGNEVSGHNDQQIWHYYEIDFMSQKSYLIVKEHKGKCYMHHIQDDEHFDISKIQNKVDKIKPPVG